MTDILLSKSHVSTAAEAIAAAQFARLGFDVSVQYGANQPEYDLMIARGGSVLKVSVKGSMTGGWQLSTGLIKNANYHGAADRWLSHHKLLTVICFVQLKDVDFNAMPRIYLARPREVAERLKVVHGGRGSGVLFEYRALGPRAKVGAGTEDRIPEMWRLSRARLEEILANPT